MDDLALDKVTIKRMISPLPLALFCVTAAVLLPQGLEAQQNNSPLPKGYQEVSSDKVVELQLLCEATAETGLFSGTVLVAEKGKVIFQQAFGLANREWNIVNTLDTRFRLASVSKHPR